MRPHSCDCILTPLSLNDQDLQPNSWAQIKNPCEESLVVVRITKCSSLWLTAERAFPLWLKAFDHVAASHCPQSHVTKLVTIDHSTHRVVLLGGEGSGGFWKSCKGVCEISGKAIVIFFLSYGPAPQRPSKQETVRYDWAFHPGQGDYIRGILCFQKFLHRALTMPHSSHIRIRERHQRPSN